MLPLLAATGRPSIRPDMGLAPGQDWLPLCILERAGEARCFHSESGSRATIRLVPVALRRIDACRRGRTDSWRWSR